MKSVLQDETKVKEAIEKTENMTAALIFLGLRAAGSNFKQLKKACSTFGIEIKKMNPSQKIIQAQKLTKIPLENILVENSTYVNKNRIKRELIKLGVFEEKCSSCNQGTIWNNFPLVLQLEHINGIYNDHRIENLCLLCPNCHSQTETFSGRKSKKTKPNNREHLRKFNPTKHELELILSGMNYTKAGKWYGVSGNAVRKRARLMGIT